MNLRLANIDDYQQIANVHFASYKEAGRENLPDSYLDKLNLSRFLLKWQERLTSRVMLTIVAEQEGKILGFATVINFNLPNDLKKEKAEINFFYVHPDHLRKKIGTKLALYMAEILIENGYNTISGWALKADIRSNGFYACLGATILYAKNAWLPLGSTPATYPDGTNADLNYFMVNDLKKTLVLFKNKEKKLNSNECSSENVICLPTSNQQLYLFSPSAVKNVDLIEKIEVKQSMSNF